MAAAVIVIDVVSVSALRPQSVAIVLEVQAARSSWVAVSESRYDAGKRTWTALSLPVVYCRNALPSHRVLMRIVAKGALLGLQFGTALLSFADLLAQGSVVELGGARRIDWRVDGMLPVRASDPRVRAAALWQQQQRG
jgi:hypothetical protein